MIETAVERLILDGRGVGATAAGGLGAGVGCRTGAGGAVGGLLVGWFDPGTGWTLPGRWRWSSARSAALPALMAVVMVAVALARSPAYGSPRTLSSGDAAERPVP